MDTKSSTSSSTRDVQGLPVAKKSRLVCKTIIYDESKANQWLDEPPLEIWDHHIIPLLSLDHEFTAVKTIKGSIDVTMAMHFESDNL